MCECVRKAASSDRTSMQHSRSLIEPLVRWFYPNITYQGMRNTILVARKCAHLTEFALLAALLWRALRRETRQPGETWDWRTARFVMVLVVAYAAADEVHQSFVPNREGAPVDVLIDACGAALALWLVRAWQRRKLRRAGAAP